MSNPRREESLSSATWAAASVNYEVKTPRTAYTRWYECFLELSYSLAGGSTSGTVKTEPAAPAGFITKFERQLEPGGYQGNKTDIPVDMLHYMSFAWLRRVPRIDPPDDGSAAAHTAELEFLFPESAVSGLLANSSLMDLPDRAGARFAITMPDAVSDYRDALLSGNDRTLTNTSSELHIKQVGHRDLPDRRLVETRLYYAKQTISGTGEIEFELPLGVGEAVRKVGIKLVDNSVRSDTYMGSNRIKVKRGTDTIRDYRDDHLQKSSPALYGIDQADWPTGWRVIDFDADLSGRELLELQRSNEKVKVVIDCPSPTGTSYIEIVCELMRATGEAARRAG